jgi:anaerobic selenocysteine-containing dehydrogenase
LELLVQIDIKMSATARFADYVVASKMSLETPAYTAIQELASVYAAGYLGLAAPWAQYTDAIVDPPADSDLLEEWEFFYGVAQRMKLQLEAGALVSFVPRPPVPLDMAVKPKTEDLIAICVQGGRVPLDEVKKHSGGAVFPEPAVMVEPKEPGWTARLDVGNPQMLSDLAAIAAQSFDAPAAATGDGSELRLVSRRLQQSYNSSGHDLAGMRRRPYNPAFMHPDDLGRLGLRAGDTVEIRSARASIVALVEADDTLRRGIVSMTHAFGGPPDRDHEGRSIGSSTSRLLTIDRDLQPYTGQPQMSNIPVSVQRVDPLPDAGAPTS